MTKSDKVLRYPDVLNLITIYLRNMNDGLEINHNTIKLQSNKNEENKKKYRRKY